MTAPVTLHVVEGGDHSFTVARTPRETVLDGVADVIAGWSAASARSRLTLASSISSIVYARSQADRHSCANLASAPRILLNRRKLFTASQIVGAPPIAATGNGNC